jgi:cytochrome bd ubiquinol oxidase subunit II
MTLAAFALAGLWVATGLEGYRIVTAPPLDTAFMPTAKTVARSAGAWMDNYGRWPLTMLFPAMGLGGAALAILASMARRSLAAFVGSGVSVAGIVLTAGAAMFPFIMPSSKAPGSGLTAWDAVASHKSLGVMFWVIVIMLPIVVLYTSWVYAIMRGKVTAAYIRENEHESY